MSRPQARAGDDGVIVASVTPFDGSGTKVDIPRLAAHLRYLAGHEGISGALVCGSAGEAMHLSDREWLKAVEAAVAALPPPLELIVGCGGRSTRNTIRQCAAALRAGATAVLVRPPNEWGLPVRDHVGFYRDVSSGIGAAVVVYSSPGLNRAQLALDDICDLAREGVLRGVKEATEDVGRLVRLLATRPSGLRLYAGSDMLGIYAATLGAEGWMSNIANVFPGLCGSAFMAARTPDTSSETAEVQRNLMLLRTEIEATGSVVAAVKCCMTLVGRSAGDPRPPILPLTRASSERLKRTLLRLDPDALAL